jgi:HAD superfamily hydrolase (TIGR01484 family)
MKKFLVILDYDGTLVERSPKGVENRLPFLNLEEVKYKYLVKHGIALEYRIITSSCAKSIEDIMTMSEMCVVDEWMFENGLHKKSYNPFRDEIESSPRTQLFNSNKHHIIEEIQKSLATGSTKKDITISEKINSIAIHCSSVKRRKEIYSRLQLITESFADVILSGYATIELFPRESNKVHILKDIPKDHFDLILFFGDSIYPNGNDYEIAHDPRIDISIEVKNAKDSLKFLENMKASTHPICTSILNGTQARIIVERTSMLREPQTSSERKKFLLLDFDGTLTHHEGQILPDILNALMELQKYYRVWVITGRSKGWADMMIHTMPIHGIIGENGAFAYYWDSDRKHMNTWSSSQVDRDYKTKLANFRSEVCAQFTFLTFASDQFCREFDLAAVINEQDITVSSEQVEQIYAWSKQRGAEASVSNIHVNFWFGTYNKAQSVIDLFNEIYGVSNLELYSRAIYIGDSHNDEPMFRIIKSSFGVKNVENFLGLMHYPPTEIVDDYEGFGTLQILSRLLNQAGQERKIPNEAENSESTEGTRNLRPKRKVQ